MKCTLSIFLVLIFTFQSVQSQVIDSLTVQSKQEMYDFHISKHKKLKTAGWILLGTGVAAMGVGGAIMYNAFMDEGGEPGEILFVAGGLATISSIPVFIIAKKNKRKGKAILGSGEVGIGAIPFNDTRYASAGIKIDF